MILSREDSSKEDSAVGSTRSFRRLRSTNKIRFLRARLFLEPLEDRRLLSNGQWFAVFTGLSPGTNLPEQAQYGQILLHAAGVTDDKVQVLDALDLSGTFLIQTPVAVTQATLTSELKGVPGFVFVQDFQSDQEREDESDLIDQEYYQNTYGPFDYSTFVHREAAGEFPGQDGSVTSAPIDVQTNNNAGSTGTANFTQSETTVLAFGNTVLIGFNDSGSNAGGSNKFSGFSRSTDGGATFTDGGTLPTSTNGDAGDPVLARNDTTGRIFYATLQFTGSGMDVFHSDDGGATWSAPVQGAPGKTNGFQDKEWIAVDNFSGPGNGNVYLVERDFGTGNGIFFYRSTDGGNTFGPNGGTLITSGSQGAFVTVGSDHAVYVFWYAGSTLQMRKSTDQGVTFGAPVTVASGLIGGTNGDLGLTGIRQGTSTAAGFRSNEFPHAAVNPANGNLYVTYNNKGAGADKADVFLVQSTNGGLTWSAPIKINDDATTTDQWQPTLAVTPGGDKLGIFYYSRQEDAANNLFKYYGRIASISGSTLTFAPSFAVSTTPSLPEFGRDSVVNGTYMGDYNTAVATAGAFHVVWSDNRDNLPSGGTRKDPNVYYQKIALGLAVTSTVPAVGSVVSTVPVDYVVNFTDPINPTTVDATDFQVDGVSADSFVINSSTQVTFHYNAAPYSSQGLHTMTMAAGAILRNGDGNPLAAFTGPFRYDALLLQVTSTNPGAGGTFSLPGPFTYDVNFNEPIDPASVQTSDLALSGIAGAVVTGVNVLPGNTTARFTISGITTEGSLTASIAAGAITDAFGNPGAAFAANYQVDVGTVAYPTPLTAKAPAGSLIYDPSISGIVNGAGDTDNFTLNVDPGQVISVLITPSSPGLQPTVQLRDPANVLLASATATSAGKPALLQTVPTSAGGVYTITVGGAANTAGGYTVQVTLNAALENEAQLGTSNDTQATAQDLNGSFLTLQTPLASTSRGAVLGGNSAAPPMPVQAFDFESGQQGFVINNVIRGTGASGGLWHLSTRRGTETGHSPTTSFYYGSETTGNYNTGAANAGTITSGPITLPNNPGVGLVFNYVLQTEGNGAFDVASVQISTNGGTSFTTIASSTSSVQLPLSSTWRTASFSLAAFAGQTVLVRFSFDTVDSILNAFEGWYVDDVQVTVPGTWSDYYSFNASANDVVSVGLKNLSGAGSNVFLENGAGTVLATGAGGATNYDSGIRNFLISTGGTYFLRVSGGVAATYDLLATRNTALDFEANNTSATAQPLDGNQGALGNASGGSNTIFDFESGVQGFTINNNVRGTGTSAGLWHLSTRRGTQAGHSPTTSFYYGSETTGNYNTGAANAGTITSGPLLIGPGSNLSFNYVLQTEGNGGFDIASVQISTNGGTSFTTIASSTSSVQLPLSSTWRTASFSLAAFAGQTVLVRFSFDTVDSILNAFEGWYVDDVQVGTAADEDWYSVNVPSAGTQLRLETRTPGDGPGEFNNSLDPHVELYDPSGNLIASGVTLSTGRNEYVEILNAPAAGNYRIRVMGEGTTRGEYFLGATVGNRPPMVSNDKPTQSDQYSDPIAPVTITAIDVTGDPLSATTSFTKDGGSAQTGLPANLVFTPKGSTSKDGLDTYQWTVSGLANVAPGQYVITVAVKDSLGAVTPTSFTINVLPEDARVAYTGTTYASAGTGTTATIALVATVQDITAFNPNLSPPLPDVYAGNITNATVTFKDRTTGTILAANVPVVLVNPADVRTGIAFASYVVNLGSASLRSLQVQVIVSGYYVRNSSSDDTKVTVSKVLPNEITGGGYTVETSSAGTYAADAESQANFGYNVKFSPSGKDLMGQVNVVYHRTVAGADHTFQIKADSITSFGVNPATPNQAQFVAQATLRDLTAGLTLGTNLTLLGSMTDKGEPGSGDTIGLTLYGSKGTLLFSNNWITTPPPPRTVELVLSGGNVQVGGTAGGGGEAVVGDPRAAELALALGVVQPGNEPTQVPSKALTTSNLALQADLLDTVFSAFAGGSVGQLSATNSTWSGPFPDSVQGQLTDGIQDGLFASLEGGRLDGKV
jgi:hypothetical protein